MSRESLELDGIITHEISNPTEWPSPVHRLSQLLQHCGLSSAIVSITHPLSPDRVSDLVQEISERLAAPDNAALALHESPSPLSVELRDFILLSVADIREIRRRRQYGYFAHARTFSLPLISRLGLLCDEQASVFADASFTLPRATSARLSQLDGHFELLVAFVAKDPKMAVSSGLGYTPSTQIGELEEGAPDEEASPIEEEENSECGDSEQTSRSNTDSEGSEGNGSGEASDSGESDVENGENHGESVESGESGESDGTSSERSLDMPLSAHLLPGRGRRLWCAIPVFAVAKSDGISPLLSSILYQRFVWGIDLPAVGITISESGDIARVILAWLDSDVNEGLPIIHVAYADEQVPCPSLGVFDLSDPIHALMLSHFVLGLRSHFRDVAEGTRTPHVQPLSWRSDHVVHDLAHNNRLQEPAESHAASIFRWASQVSDDTRQVVGPVVAGKPLSPSMAPKSSTSSKPSKSSNKGKSVDQAGKPDIRSQRAQTKAAQSAPQSIPEILEPKAEAKAKVDKKPTEENLAKLSAADVKTVLTISSFLFERGVIAVTRLKLSAEQSGDEFNDVSLFINKMIDVYDDLAEYRWLGSWTATTILSEQHPILKPICDLLVSDHQIVSDRLKSIPELDSELAPILARKLPEILLASVGAYSLLAVASARGVSEAESRHNWDALLYRFFVTGDEYISKNVLFERTLNYSRNPALDAFKEAIKESDVIAAVAEQFDQTKTINGDILHNASRITFKSAKLGGEHLLLHNQVIAFQQEADRTIASMDRTKLKAQIMKHGPKEPKIGIADAILVVPIHPTKKPDLSKTDIKETINKFGLIHYMEPYKQKDKPDFTKSTGALFNVLTSDSDSVGNTMPRPAPSPHLSTSKDQARKDTLQPLGGSPTSGLDPDTKRALVKSPLFISCTETQGSTTPPEWRFDPSAHGELDFRYPVLMVEHKRNDTTEHQVLNQTRLYCTAAITFLATLQITEQPVFGLVTCGSKGTVIMCWKFKEQIYIMERNMRTFDISEPLQAFHLATFLLRLAKWSQQLHAKYSAKDKNVADRLYKYAQDNTDATKIWTKMSQNPKSKKDKPASL
ncbi:hypothetical protein Hypma_014044 [Hypsizygus marmoreus]|uniref:Uncharacterized protein n=1 Tax=Hypsizygus marmoreus TaxID=39966 RepID=A0A369K5J3_HYPMA|nr:hypothetical protein Hypma_014044 [Hypsizygus marmoreus]